MISEDLSDWNPKIKTYPHFDPPFDSIQEIKDFVQNKDVVSNHIFSPFLSYTQTIKKFNSKKSKERLIRYACRKDSYIYSYYRSILLNKYDKILKDEGLNEFVIAYRRVMDTEEERGKCNIDFARDAFDKVKEFGNCIAIAFDISKFFESLEHSLIKDKWKFVIGEDKLPDDHYSVFRGITSYQVVDRDSCYKLLGLMRTEVKEAVRFGKKVKKKINVYSYKREEQPKTLCSLRDYKEKIIKGRLIKNNPYLKIGQKRGIPQGSPISDVIANMCLLDFDIKIKKFIDEKGGYYRRYSDDIVIIIPHDEGLLTETNSIVKKLISSQGDSGYLRINDSKTIITEFCNKNGAISYKTTDGANNLKNNVFEYLGFGFDGNKALIKPQTITGYYKKIERGVSAYMLNAFKKAKQDQAKNLDSYINVNDLFHKYTKPDGRRISKSSESIRNFTHYSNRSVNIMNNPQIKSQIKNARKFIQKLFKKEKQKYTRIL